jgi:hypothetical protein
LDEAGGALIASVTFAPASGFSPALCLEAVGALGVVVVGLDGLVVVAEPAPCLLKADEVEACAGFVDLVADTTRPPPTALPAGPPVVYQFACTLQQVTAR